jgi:hypothetical protein
MTDAIRTLTDVPVISADCAMTDDYLLMLGLLLWVACIPTVDPYGLISPCGLMDSPYW